MNKNIMLVGSVAALLLGSSAVLAHEKAVSGDIAVEGAAANGIVSSGGNAVITGLGECLISGGYSDENTNDGCEGRDSSAAAEPEAETEVAEAPKEESADIVSVENLSGQALFATASSTLNGAGEQALANLVAKLETYQEISKITITGHTDSRGTEANNQALSERRAATVAAYIEAAYPGVSVNSLGLGESAPRQTNSTAAGRQANRRVEVQVRAKSVTQN